MSSLLLKIKTIVFIFFAGCVFFILLIIFIFASSIVYNEIRLAFFTEETRKYAHPQDSKRIQRISFVGNFAPASNQCGFIIAEVHSTTLKPNDIRAFYKPILTFASNGNPPYHEVTLFMLSDKKDAKSLEQWYAELYEKIAQKEKGDNVYLLLTAETGYPPNYDFRCH